MAGAAEELRTSGSPAIFAAVDGKPAAIFSIADPVKLATAQTLGELKAEGTNVVMVTGDNWAPANAVAAQLGVEGVRAEVLPETKGEVVSRFRSRREVVAIAVVNDAPALATANVGIAMGTGTDVAIQSGYNLV